MSQQFFNAVLKALTAIEPTEKHALIAQIDTDGLNPACARNDDEYIVGRPSKPDLVAPRFLEQRKLNTTTGQAAMVHAICHIEFNAINLALDACYRFRGMPLAYYLDWLRVAREEAKHFMLLSVHLHELEHSYGDFPAHNGLWDLAMETKYDVLARMALVPRIMEARGLDVSPQIMKKFASVGNQRMVDILQIIFDEEIGHVQIGNHWFHYLCEQRQLCPDEAFRALAKRHVNGQIKLPFHTEARLQAGFNEHELAVIAELA